MRGVTWALAIVAAVAAVAGLVLIAFTRNPGAKHMRADLAAHLERGGIADLDEARALARRLVVADRNDRDAAGALAFADAMLAIDYGMDTGREVQAVLAPDGPGEDGGAVMLSPSPRGDPADDSLAPAAAARALLTLSSGDRSGAVRAAAVAAVLFPGAPYTLYALGRIRALNGETAAGERALKAVVIGSPSFLASRVSWAEARLDLGDAQGARSALQTVLAKAPGDLRAGLLLDEAEQALGMAGGDTLRAACPVVRDRWPPPAIRSACALAQAGRARRSGVRAEALGRAEEAANLVPAVPRLQARIAQALAQLGAVDRAASLLERARRMAAVETPSLAWATAAVALGRGKAPLLPGGPRPADPECRLLAARSALAAGGAEALATALDGLGASAVAADVDLQLLARLSDNATTPFSAVDADDPVRAYVDGLRARLDGNLPGAAARLRHALSGHGDACRAAGEYLAIVRVQKQQIDPASWNLLRAENASCVNLH